MMLVNRKNDLSSQTFFNAVPLFPPISSPPPIHGESLQPAGQLLEDPFSKATCSLLEYIFPLLACYLPRLLLIFVPSLLSGYQSAKRFLCSCVCVCVCPLLPPAYPLSSSPPPKSTTLVVANFIFI